MPAHAAAGAIEPAHAHAVQRMRADRGGARVAAGDGIGALGAAGGIELEPAGGIEPTHRVGVASGGPIVKAAKVSTAQPKG